MTTIFSLTLIVGLLASHVCPAAEHPFLIVKKENFRELRDRSGNNPWKDMKSRAISQGSSPLGSLRGKSLDRAQRIIDNVSGAALAYILDPGRKDRYVDNIKIALNKWDQHLAYIKSADSRLWGYVVPTGAAFFNSVLALDVVHDELSALERSQIESKLERVADWFRLTGNIFPPNQFGALGIWSLYKGDMPDYQKQLDGYRQAIFDQFTDDGIFSGGSRYASARFNGQGNGDAKTNLMDIAEFTKTGTFYTDPRLISFYEWLYGHSNAPFDMHVTFGDTPFSKSHPYGSIHTGSTGICRAYRFSKLAGSYAAYRNRNASFPGRLLHYVLLDRPLETPAKPVSRIWHEGYAGLWEKNVTDRSLMGALWSPTRTFGHSHKEANAIYLCAYGEPVLINSGYGGIKAILGYPREYYANRAESGNTVTIEYDDHAAKTGGGIVEGFVGNAFDYACGSSGPATAKVGEHHRSLCMIHPQGGRPGYFVLFDEVVAKTPGATVRMMLHPNSNAITEISEGIEYSARVSPRRFSSNTVYLNIFMGTPSDSVKTKLGGIAAYNNEGFVGQYLQTTCHTDSLGQKNMVTVLAPRDPGHPVPEMSRLQGPGFTGVRLDHGDGVTDHALESDGTKNIAPGDVEFSGRACWYRKTGPDIPMFFVRSGKRFGPTSGVPKGFDADKEISIFLRNGVGNLVSPGTRVLFRKKGITSVYLNWTKAKTIEKGQDWVRVEVSSGNFDLVLADRQTTVRPREQRDATTLQLQVMYGPTGRVSFRTQANNTEDLGLAVYDLLGRRIWRKTLQPETQGGRTLFWDSERTHTSSGIYIVRLSSPNHSVSRRFVTAP